MSLSRTYQWAEPAEIAARMRDGMSGLEFLSAIRDGKLPGPPIAATLDFRLTEVAHGVAVFRALPQSFHYNPIGSVHGGFYSTILDSCMSCAVHSTLPAGVTYTTLEFNIHVVRALREENGEVAGEGKVVHAGRRVSTSEGRIVDKAGVVYAHGTATCLIMDLAPTATRGR